VAAAGVVAAVEAAGAAAAVEPPRPRRRPALGRGERGALNPPQRPDCAAQLHPRWRRHMPLFRPWSRAARLGGAALIEPVLTALAFILTFMCSRTNVH